MSTATLFPDDDIHDTADDWKDPSDDAPNESEQDANPPRPPDPPDKPPKPYHNGTLTSRAAAEFVRPSVNSQMARVWGFIDSHGNHGATDKEIQAGLKMDGNSQRPRRVWLMRNGYIKPKGAPCETVVRDRSTVWVVAKRLELSEANPKEPNEGSAQESKPA